MAREVAGRVLHPREARRGELAGQRRIEVVHRPRRDVVHERRRAVRRLQHGEEVAPQLDLGDRIEPRHVGRDRVRAGVERAARQRDRGARARPPDLRDHAQRPRGCDRALDQRDDLVLLEQHALAGRAGDEDAVQPASRSHSTCARTPPRRAIRPPRTASRPPPGSSPLGHRPVLVAPYRAVPCGRARARGRPHPLLVDLDAQPGPSGTAMWPSLNANTDASRT